jgi:hypothetical protein
VSVVRESQATKEVILAAGELTLGVAGIVILALGASLQIARVLKSSTKISQGS